MIKYFKFKSEADKQLRRESVVVHNFTLPQPYIDFLGSEMSDRDYWWKVDKTLWYSIFLEEEIENPFLFSFETMVYLNENEWGSEEWARKTKGLYFGRADGVSSPGILCPQKSVLIGETGTDSPIALDFSASSHNPSVCYLAWTNSNPPHWKFVAPDIDTFLRNLCVSL